MTALQLAFAIVCPVIWTGCAALIALLGIVNNRNKHPHQTSKRI